MVLAAPFAFRSRIEIAINMVRHRLGKRTVQDRLREFGNAARERRAIYAMKSGIEWPPSRIKFVALKEERLLEVFVSDGGDYKLLRRYPILAASGGPGPKLREGDNQVPEGIYKIESLNPNSTYHVSLRLNYPNDFDRAQAAKEGRTRLGGDIMIHGKAVSIGCIAVGDEAAEDLFTLAADVGLKNVTVVCSPFDFRKRKEAPPVGNSQPWMTELYQRIAAELPAP